MTVTLEKDSYGSLGFSVAGAASLGGCYIKKIIKDPALANGVLQAGDRLLEVSSLYYFVFIRVVFFFSKLISYNSY